MNISIGVQMLSITTSVPKVWKTRTAGLLGNFDGDPNNDFMMPNETKLDGDINERAIFEYGQTCKHILLK